MSNLAMKLDTLSYANKLIDAGCERKLAEAHASVQQDTLVEISQEYLSQFVTKEEFKSEAAWVRHEFSWVRQEFALVRQEMRNLGMSLTIRLGTLMAVLMTIGIAVLTFILKS